VHRLVALAFRLLRLPGQDTVDHIDNDTTNNRVENLRWLSQRQQVQHSHASNLAHKSSAGRTSKPVRGRKRGAATWISYASVSEAARAIGAQTAHVLGACNKGHQCLGYEFEYDYASTEPPLLAGEEWRPVGSTAAAVSSLGRFKSIRGVITTPAPCPSGYVSVAIHKHKYKIHRLMAEAFELPRAPGQDSVDHIDNNPGNNRIENLRWATQEEQVQHSYASNSQRNSSAGRTSKPLRGRKVGTEAWTSYPSACEAGRALGLHASSVSQCCSGRLRTTGGYEFAYAKPTEPDLLPGEIWRDVLIDFTNHADSNLEH